MGTVTHHETEYRGILSGLKARLQNNRLGELLVINGSISHHQLQQALLIGRASGQKIGYVLAHEHMVGRRQIHQALIEQFMLRFMLASMTMFLSFAGGATPARAASIKDVPARIAFQQASVYTPIAAYPKIFGSTEKESTSLSAFTKWTSMFNRFDAALNTSGGQQSMVAFKSQLEQLRGQSFLQMVSGVNEIVNRVPYINDNQNYGQSDHWATPVEFLQRGGDCEDFAITKYVALRALGVPEERMRILILQDMQKNIPHAVLVVYTDNGPVLLDNQLRNVTPVSQIFHYKPIFSINRDGWWLHTKPQNGFTTVASASR